MLGLSPRLVGLLGRNYQLVAAGWGQVAGRAARIVTARRPGGRLAARFWLDKATYLPLRRQVFDPAGHMISDVAFASVRFGPTAVTRAPVPAARPWGDVLTPAGLARLRGEGWPLPEPLPGRLSLLGARQHTAGGSGVIELDYSDGLSVVSVFVQRGHLPAKLSGWRPAVVSGYRVYTDEADGNGVAWSARGFVYTVIAEAPAQTMAQVLAALPHDSPPGMLGRIRQGLRRLVSWFKF
jgi:sigma-E factor negative regulatory protein RseB